VSLLAAASAGPLGGVHPSWDARLEYLPGARPVGGRAPRDLFVPTAAPAAPCARRCLLLVPCVGLGCCCVLAPSALARVCSRQASRAHWRRGAHGGAAPPRRRAVVLSARALRGGGPRRRTRRKLTGLAAPEPLGARARAGPGAARRAGGCGPHRTGARRADAPLDGEPGNGGGRRLSQPGRGQQRRRGRGGGCGGDGALVGSLLRGAAARAAASVCVRARALVERRHVLRGLVRHLQGPLPPFSFLFVPYVVVHFRTQRSTI
jgi:hypothetical protein